MEAWRRCFGAGALKVVGMIHVPALPGTPRNSQSIGEIAKRVQEEALLYVRNGVDSIMLENMHDVPYQQPNMMGPETVSYMTRICSLVRSVTPLSMPCGIQILASANREAMAVASAAELQYIRCEGFVFSHVADEGWTNSCAAELMRYRKQLAAQGVLVFCDVKKKHSSHAVTSDVSIGETAAAAEMFLADGIVVTGTGTGHAADPSDLEAVKAASTLPVLIGSGVTPANIKNFSHADGLIVGSYFKKDGRWKNELEGERIEKLMMAVKSIRKNY